MAYFTIAFIILYGFGLFYWNKKQTGRLKPGISKTIKTIHYIGIAICLVLGFLYVSYGIGLRGLWTTRIISIITLFIGIFFSFFTDKTVLNKLEKWYFKLFSFLPVAAAAVLFIPLLGAVLVFSFLGRLFMPVAEIYYEDDILRVQSTFQTILIGNRTEAFEKHFFYEKQLESPDYWGKEVDSISVSYHADTTKISTHGLDEYDGSDENGIMLYSIRKSDSIRNFMK
ncbi:MAG: hypothetical protein JWM14_3380 [Chitinophagaceae bacterium]|nr:hypothetical protein [Chitinophagaceae bacterium]